MNFSDIIKSLNSASAFELYRLRAAIERVLAEPRWLQAIQTRLKVGQTVQYFNIRANALKRGQVLEMRRKEVLILDMDDAERWLLSYAAINLDGVDVQIREQKPQGLGRNEVALGDVVGFLDREQQQRTGKVIRLNDKTVTLQCDKSQWRVAYSFLHRVLDIDGTAHEGQVHLHRDIAGQARGTQDGGCACSDGRETRRRSGRVARTVPNDLDRPRCGGA